MVRRTIGPLLVTTGNCKLASTTNREVAVYYGSATVKDRIPKSCCPALPRH